mgnify:CR=1 FL=1
MKNNGKERIALIIPPSPFLADERVFPALGLLRVAGALEQIGMHVDVIDCSGYKNYTDIVRDYCSQVDVGILGVGCTTPQLPFAEKIIQTIREVKPKARVVLGGVHVTTTCNSHKREMRLGVPGRATSAFNHLLSIADVLISGDGERSIILALDDNCPQLIDGDDPDSQLFIQAKELANFPFPSRHLIDLSSYHYYIEGIPATSIIAQLGCPFLCSFCGARFSPSFRRMRLRPIDNVLAEIEDIYKRWGIHGLFFLDDEMNVNKNLTTDLIAFRQLQKQLGVEFRCRGFLKAELLTEPQAQALYDAGFRQVLIGFESGNPRILKNIKKRATLDDNTRAIDLCHKVGLSVKALMSCGHAGETPDTIEHTQDWLIKVHPEDFDLTCIQPYPSTPYWDLAVKHPNERDVWVYSADNGDRLYMREINFSSEPLFYKGVPGEYKVFVYTDYISSEEIAHMRDLVESNVRKKLSIPFYQTAPVSIYEHSMGQGFPNGILRSSEFET